VSGPVGPWPVLMAGWYLLAILAVPAGLWTFAKHEAGGRRGPARLAHTRPVGDAMLACAKLGSSAATVLVTFAIVSLFSLAAWAVFAILDLGIGAPDFVVPEVMEQCAIVFAALGATWIAYTRGGFVVSVFLLLGFSEELLSDTFPELHTHLWEMTPSMPPLALRLSLLAASLLLCWPFVRASWKGLLSPRAMVVLLGAWASCAVIVSLVLLRMAPDSSAGLSVNLRIMACWVCGTVLSLLALSPFAPVALRVDRLRHS